MGIRSVDWIQDHNKTQKDFDKLELFYGCDQTYKREVYRSVIAIKDGEIYVLETEDVK